MCKRNCVKGFKMVQQPVQLLQLTLHHAFIVILVFNEYKQIAVRRFHFL